LEEEVEEEIEEVKVVEVEGEMIEKKTLMDSLSWLKI